MEYFILCFSALITSLLTFFSGFGLGTILTPVFAIFFPIEAAIALTGIVHFLNNVFKLVLIGPKANRQVVVMFGLPAFIASIVGALLLVKLNALAPLYSYSIGQKLCLVTPVKVVVALLLIFFALLETLPSLKKLGFGKNLILGGLLSGFFGGLSGNQGALRSAFLINANLSKEAFIASGVVIACFVDFSRLGVYFTRFSESGLHENIGLVIAATCSAFAGAFIGSKLLNKVTMKPVQIIVTIMLIMLSIALASGFV
ncbi:MAG: TSUP family transporter [Chryseolinea sp.]